MVWEKLDRFTLIYIMFVLKLTFKDHCTQKQTSSIWKNTWKIWIEDSFFVIKLFCHRSVWHLKVHNLSLVAVARLPFVWNLVKWLSLRWTIWRLPQTSRHRSEEASSVLINIHVGEIWELWAVACTDIMKGRGEKKGTSARTMAPKSALYYTFWLPRGHFNACFGSQEGTLVCVLAPKRAL